MSTCLNSSELLMSELVEAPIHTQTLYLNRLNMCTLLIHVAL